MRTTGVESFIQTCRALMHAKAWYLLQCNWICYSVQDGNENDRVEEESRSVIQSLAPLQLLSTLLPLLSDLSSPDLGHLAR